MKPKSPAPTKTVTGRAHHLIQSDQSTQQRRAANATIFLDIEFSEDRKHRDNLKVALEDEDLVLAEQRAAIRL